MRKAGIAGRWMLGSRALIAVLVRKAGIAGRWMLGSRALVGQALWLVRKAGIGGRQVRRVVIAEQISRGSTGEVEQTSSHKASCLESGPWLERRAVGEWPSQKHVMGRREVLERAPRRQGQESGRSFPGVSRTV